MRQYTELVKRIFLEGDKREERTGVGTLSVFGHHMTFNLEDGLPVVTEKRTTLKPVVRELLWLLSGETNILPLVRAGVHIWTAWPLECFNAYERSQGVPKDMVTTRAAFEDRLCEDSGFAEQWGDLGPVYGKQWRAWRTPTGTTVDQLALLVEGLRTQPHGRRHVVSAWNPGELRDMALPPCHALYQFYVAGGRLSCQLYQRSADVFLGLPFNIASYAMLTHMVAQVVGLGVGQLHLCIGDAHLYLNHLPQAGVMLGREALPLPTLRLNPEVRSLYEVPGGPRGFTFEDVEVVGYQSHPALHGEVAV